ncbi:MAG: redoxin domain-containing protein [bacterium]|nr:redoxin domain-containing protein [bacterium]
MRAPEFPQNLRWFNLPATQVGPASSPPLVMKELRGHKVVLIDFWTYSCVNCIRTLPHLKAWQEKYSSAGLVIIGVHTPEFEFEKEVSRVQSAIKNLGISYPVVMDSDYQIWSLYDNSYWPRKFLINKDGQIVYDHAGEGGYRETELAIQAALLELNPKLKIGEVTGEEGLGAVCYPITPETYLGSMRGRPGKTWQVKGEWKTHPEFIEHEGKTENFEDYLALHFEAAEVNLVMEAKTERPVKIRLELGGKFLNDLEVQEPKMYNLLSGKEHARNELKIFVKDGGIRMYAFTFGGACN